VVGGTCDFLESQRRAACNLLTLQTDIDNIICCDRCGIWRPWPSNRPVPDESDDSEREVAEVEDGEPFFCSMHNDPRFASCDAPVLPTRIGPRFQATALARHDALAPIADRGDLRVEIRPSDLPQKAQRKCTNHGSSTLASARGKGRVRRKHKPTRRSPSAVDLMAGLPVDDSQHFANAADCEEQWAREAAEQAATRHEAERVEADLTAADQATRQHIAVGDREEEERGEDRVVLPDEEEGSEAEEREEGESEAAESEAEESVGAGSEYTNSSEDEEFAMQPKRQRH